MAYGVVHTTNLSGCDNYSFQHTADIENGILVAKGELVTGERQVYQAVLDAKKPAYLVANPAWNYDDSTYAKKQEDAYINKANKAFRVYELKPDKKFAITSYSIVNGNDTAEIAVGDTLGVNTAGKLDKSVSDSALLVKVESIDNYGFTYAVGSAGSVDTGAKMVTVRVIQNESVTSIKED